VRQDLGLPNSWSSVQDWLDFNKHFTVPELEMSTSFKLKCPDLAELKDYRNPPDDYWKSFPFNPLRRKVSSPISATALRSMVTSYSHRLTSSQLSRAFRAIEGIEKGMSSHQLRDLPPIVVKNTSNTLTYGRQISDAVAHWVRSGFASGPFSSPPLDGFRVNCLMAIPQEGKVRPVLNVSAPAGLSLNDNTNKYKLEKITMSSAREFGYLLIKCGRNATMSKSDVCDAYKIVPVPLEELRIQGFSFGGKYFVENSQIFGANSAPCNFDQVNHTVVDLAVVSSETLEELVIRHLDDVVCAAPAKSKQCEKFTEIFRNICKELGIKLQPDCPKKEKAFKNSKFGKVLGIWFNSEDLTWKLPDEKKDKCLRAIEEALQSQSVNLLDMQKLMGNLNNVSLMCPFLKGFKRPLNDCLAEACEKGETRLSAQAKRDLKVWAGLLVREEFLPIPREPVRSPTLYHKTFASDAAGVPDDNDFDHQAVAGIGLDEVGELILAFRHEWDQRMIESGTDVDGKRFGNKTAFLESVGILVPFMLMPDKLKNQHVLFKMDNIGCVHGWENRGLKEDNYASIVIRAIHLVSAYLSCYVHVVHVPRKTDWEGEVADRMTRRSSTTTWDRRLLLSFGDRRLPSFLSTWLSRPDLNWRIANSCLEYVKEMVPE